MSSNITKTKTIRLSNEVADFFSDKPVRQIMESLYQNIQDGNITLSDGLLSVHTAELEDLGNAYHLADLYEQAQRQIAVLEEEVRLSKEVGFVNYPKEDHVLSDEEAKEMKNLREACMEKGTSVTDALRKVAQQVWNVRL